MRFALALEILSEANLNISRHRVASRSGFSSMFLFYEGACLISTESFGLSIRSAGTAPSWL